MLIRCPTCASGYDLSTELLHEGRILRCAYCRDAWTQGPVAEAPPPPETIAAPGSDGLEIVTETRFFRRAGPGGGQRAAAPHVFRSQPRLPAWATTVAASALCFALLGGGMAAVAQKARIVAAFPPSEAVFATLGLPVNLSGLSLGEIRSTVETNDAGATLTLVGHITNLRTDPTMVPPLRIAVRDKSRRELYYWTAPAPKAQLAVGETVQFRSRLSSPPRDGLDLAVSFAEPSAVPRRVAEVLAGR